MDGDSGESTEGEDVVTAGKGKSQIVPQRNATQDSARRRTSLCCLACFKRIC